MELQIFQCGQYFMDPCQLYWRITHITPKTIQNQVFEEREGKGGMGEGRVGEGEGIEGERRKNNNEDNKTYAGKEKE